MGSSEYAFPRRNGFAMHEDLGHPELRKWLRLCLQENERFCGRAHLDWSRQWEYPFALGNLPETGARRRVLDAGCGYRFFTPLLARRGFEVDACDLDPSIGPRYDEIAARDELAIEFSQQDLAQLTYPDDRFDFICCISVLEHSRDPVRIVREFRRCLAPGGTLVLTFDVSVNGDRDIPVPAARELIAVLDEELAPATPFHGAKYLDPEVLARADEVLRTEWFRRYRPELLPWRVISRATLANLRRGRFGRPFFDLAVIGLVHRKPA